MARDLTTPVPADVRDTIWSILQKVPVDRRYEMRDNLRRMYGRGYDDGYHSGARDAQDDDHARSEAEKKAAATAETSAAIRRWDLLHEAIHGGLADCDETGADGSRCGSCLGCRITQEVGEHD